MGRLIVFEGVDRVGKTTQYNMLAEQLRACGYSASQLHFPSYSEVGELLRRYLRGQVYMRPEAAALVFEADRWNMLDVLLRELDRHDFVILDRFWRSGLAYDAARRDGEIDPWMEAVARPFIEEVAWREELIYLNRPSTQPIGRVEEVNDEDAELALLAAKAFDVLNSRYPPGRLLDLVVTWPSDGTPVPANIVSGSIFRFVMRNEDDQ